MFGGNFELLYLRSRSQQIFKKSTNVCPDDIFSTAEPFTTTLGKVMHHHEPGCPAKRLIYYLQGQGHSWGLNNKIMTFYYLFWTADPFATKLAFMVYHIEPGCVLKRLDCRQDHKNKFKVSMNVHLYDIFWTAKPFVSKFGIGILCQWMYICPCSVYSVPQNTSCTPQGFWVKIKTQ